MSYHSIIIQYSCIQFVFARKEKAKKEKDKKTVERQYFYGISLLETNKTTEAEVIFKELQSGNSSYKNKAIWGLALAKLKQKEYNSCKNLLLTIPSDYENYEQVQKLLKELE